MITENDDGQKLKKSYPKKEARLKTRRESGWGDRRLEV